MSKTTTNETLREIIMIPLDDKLQSYPKAANPFKPYKGERLERLSKSIKAHGVIHSIIVQQMRDGTYRIISGHNRVNAAKEAEQTEIPAIVRDDLTEEEADLLVIESNLEQRTFERFLPSEKAKSINQYHGTISKPGFRSDILKPIDETSGQVDQKWDARKTTAKVYGVGEGIIKRYLQLHKLAKPLMDRLDNYALKCNRDTLRITPAANISFIPSEIQEMIEAVLKDDKASLEVTIKKSEALRKEFETAGVSSAADKKAAKERIKEILTQTDDSKEGNSDNLIKIPIPAEKYAELFPDAPSLEEVVDYTIKAVERLRNSDADDQEVG